MGVYESIWLLISLLIILIILSTDPKSSTNGIGNNNLTFMFSSITESQKFLRTFTWVLISAFYLLTLCINYFN